MIPATVYGLVLRIREKIDSGEYSNAKTMILEEMEKARSRMRQLVEERESYLKEWGKNRRRPFTIGIDTSTMVFRRVFNPAPTFPLDSAYREIMEKIELEAMKVEELNKLLREVNFKLGEE